MRRLIALLLFLLPPLLSLAQVEPDCTKMLRDGDNLMARKDPPLEEALRCYLNALNCNAQLAGEVGPKLKGVFDAIKKQKESEQTEKNRAQKALENSRHDQINKLLADAEVFRKDKRFPDALRSYDNALKLAKPAEKDAIEQQRSATLSVQIQFDFERNRDIGMGLMAAEDGRAALPYLLKALEAKPADTILSKTIARCDTTTNSYTAYCGTNETCLCDSFFTAGQALRGEEHFDEAVKRFEAVAQLCPERNARAVIDSIYREHRIWIYRDGKFAIATPLGEPITPFQFSNPEPFHKGVAIFSENEKYFFVDKDGKVLTPLPGFDGIMAAEGGLFYLNGKDQYSNTASSFTTETGLYPVFWDTGWDYLQFNLLDFYPTMAFDSLRLFFNRMQQYDYAENLEDGLISFKKNGKWGLTDKNGREISASTYEYIMAGQRGFAKVQKNGKMGLIDKNGREIITPQYEEIWDFYGGFAKFKNSGRWGLTDTNGCEIIPPKYEEIDGFFFEPVAGFP